MIYVGAVISLDLPGLDHGPTGCVALGSLSPALASTVLLLPSGFALVVSFSIGHEGHQEFSFSMNTTSVT